LDTISDTKSIELLKQDSLYEPQPKDFVRWWDESRFSFDRPHLPQHLVLKEMDLWESYKSRHKTLYLFLT